MSFECMHNATMKGKYVCTYVYMILRMRNLLKPLLYICNAKVGTKHSVSVSNVAVRWVLDQPAVGGAIVGIRRGSIPLLFVV